MNGAKQKTLMYLATRRALARLDSKNRHAYLSQRAFVSHFVLSKTRTALTACCPPRQATNHRCTIESTHMSQPMTSSTAFLSARALLLRLTRVIP